MKKILAALPLAGLLALPIGAIADKGAGCGLGQQIFAGQSGLGPHVLAATTNGTVSNQLFGLSFDSLGCVGESMVTAEYQRNLYVAGNMDNIARDAAKGTGDHLHALADLLTIESADQATFYKMVQTRYSDLFVANSSDSEAFLTRLDTAMANEPQLSKYITL
ncbi:MAG TPA: hypothetical protein DD827_11105 [Gammaproteobacteria bacterium]|jgi:hypothetical protein|nr:hypothetical protein [Gammaproteobacteria bacterium]